MHNGLSYLGVLPLTCTIVHVPVRFTAFANIWFASAVLEERTFPPTVEVSC